MLEWNGADAAGLGSPSSRRAWIELFLSHAAYCGNTVALLAEGVDRNTYYDPRLAALGESPSSRRAWIEITTLSRMDPGRNGALLAEGVDRNNGAFECQLHGS